MGSDTRTSFSSAISAKKARQMGLCASMRKGKPALADAGQKMRQGGTPPPGPQNEGRNTNDVPTMR
jgi:hypothetical protein